MTPATFNKLQTSALDSYYSASFALADVLSAGKEEFGRKTLMEMTPLSLSKVQWFVALASVTKRDSKLTPDHHFEASQAERPTYWLSVARQQKLKPLELRAAIRDQQKCIKEDRQALSGISTLPKTLDMVEREVKRLDPERKEKAKELIEDLLRKL